MQKCDHLKTSIDPAASLFCGFSEEGSHGTIAPQTPRLTEKTAGFCI
jgi:hypothetical protein